MPIYRVKIYLNTVVEVEAKDELFAHDKAIDSIDLFEIETEVVEADNQYSDLKELQDREG